MFVWQHLEICHWMGFEKKRKKYKKCRLSYFYNWLYLCILYQWNFLYWRLKDTTQTGRNRAVWPGGVADPDWSLTMISSWHGGSWLLITDFLEDLWLYFFHFFFLTWVSFLSFLPSLSFCLCFVLSVFFPEGRWVSLSFFSLYLFFFFLFLCFINSSSKFVYTTAVSFIWLYCAVYTIRQL